MSGTSDTPREAKAFASLSGVGGCRDAWLEAVEEFPQNDAVSPPCQDDGNGCGSRAEKRRSCGPVSS